MTSAPTPETEPNPDSGSARRRPSPPSRRAGGNLHSTGQGAPGRRLSQSGAGGELADQHADKTLAERFDAKFIAIGTGGCMIWTAATTSDGYGYIRAWGRMERAHRISWVMHKGPIPAGLQVLHRCDNPLCVNPGHLFLGTHAENMRDMAKKGRAASGDVNGNTKLTDIEVAEIRTMAGKMLQREIAALYGVNKNHVGVLIRGEQRTKKYAEPSAHEALASSCPPLRAPSLGATFPP